jgi:hypothetical protein
MSSSANITVSKQTVLCGTVLVFRLVRCSLVDELATRRTTPDSLQFMTLQCHGNFSHVSQKTNLIFLGSWVFTRHVDEAG